MTNRKTAKPKLAPGFTKSSNALLRSPNLSALEVRLAALLMSHDGPKGCFPSQKTLAAETACSERWVREALKSLEGSGLISMAAPTKKNGSKRYKVDGLYAMTGATDDRKP